VILKETGETGVELFIFAKDHEPGGTLIEAVMQSEVTGNVFLKNTIEGHAVSISSALSWEAGGFAYHQKLTVFMENPLLLEIVGLLQEREAVPDLNRVRVLNGASGIFTAAFPGIGSAFFDDTQTGLHGKPGQFLNDIPKGLRLALMYILLVNEWTYRVCHGVELWVFR
jgi:hypothetical protein